MVEKQLLTVLLNKENNYQLRHHWLPREMKSEERAQKFHANDV